MNRILSLALPLAAVSVLVAGCGGGSFSTTTATSSGFGSGDATESADSGGPCNGHPCIGDWQKEAAEGGTVVQCSDGTWSHAGGISGACSDHGGETSAQLAPDESSSTDVPATTTEGAGPCDGNPCIGDWEKEAAEGGTVVQCADGAWSHAGGISGACSDHGGVSTGDSTGTAPPPSPSGGTTGAQGLPVQCGYGVSGSTGTTCAFAENAFYEYWKASDGGSSPSENISAWSAEGGQSYPLSCDLGDGVVDCTGTDGSGIPLDARFSQSAISAYTTSQATAYAASGKLGPSNNASSGGLTPADQNPNDASAADCDGTMEIGPRSDCFVAQKVAGDLGKGVWSAPGADTVSEGSSTLTFHCSVVGHDDSQSSRPAIYRCVSDGDSADWFEFEFT